MDSNERRRRAEAWKRASLERLLSARHLLDGGFYRDVASRSYYAVFYAGTFVSVLHGDSERFPQGWNNPTHEQLPELIFANGDLTPETRQRVRPLLRTLRVQREAADYRVGQTFTQADATEALRLAALVCGLLVKKENDD